MAERADPVRGRSGFSVFWLSEPDEDSGVVSSLMDTRWVGVFEWVRIGFGGYERFH
jgi:hypothetical protein